MREEEEEGGEGLPHGARAHSCKTTYPAPDENSLPQDHIYLNRQNSRK